MAIFSGKKKAKTPSASSPSNDGGSKFPPKRGRVKRIGRSIKLSDAEWDALEEWRQAKGLTSRADYIRQELFHAPTSSKKDSSDEFPMSMLWDMYHSVLLSQKMWEAYYEDIERKDEFDRLNRHVKNLVNMTRRM